MSPSLCPQSRTFWFANVSYSGTLSPGQQHSKAEAAATQAECSNDAKVNAEYAKTRQGLITKYATAEREARLTDEQRRRSIIDAALKGEAQAKAEFAAVSRRIASEFDGVPQEHKVELSRAKNEAAGAVRQGTKRPPQSMPLP